MTRSYEPDLQGCICRLSAQGKWLFWWMMLTYTSNLHQLRTRLKGSVEGAAHPAENTPEQRLRSHSIPHSSWAQLLINPSANRNSAQKGKANSTTCPENSPKVQAPTSHCNRQLAGRHYLVSLVSQSMGDTGEWLHFLAITNAQTADTHRQNTQGWNYASY